MAVYEPIDGAAVLADELRSAGYSRMLAALERGELYKTLRNGLASTSPDEYRELVARLFFRCAVWWPPRLARCFPVLVPWAVRDRSCRYDQGPESWGSPRSDGYLRDDNSIIKKLPLTLPITAPPSSPYDCRKLGTGFTACHIWRGTSDGTASGEHAFLYSFLPNLVWLPRPLAPLTDTDMAFPQVLLKATTLRMFTAEEPARAVAQYIRNNWRHLALAEAASVIPDGWTSPTDLATFTPTVDYARRRLKYNRKLTAGVAAAASGEPLARRIICSRYTVGLPLLAAPALQQLAQTLSRYDDAVEDAISEIFPDDG